MNAENRFENLDVAVQYHKLGESLEKSNEFEKALEQYKRAYEIRGRIIGENTLHPDIASSLLAIGVCLEKLGKSNDSINFLNKAFQMRKELFPKDNQLLVETLIPIGDYYIKVNKPKKAIPFYENAVDAFEKIFTNPSLDHIDSLEKLGNAYDVDGDPLTAAVSYQKAYDVLKKLDPDSYEKYGKLINCLDNLGNCYDRIGRLKLALEKKKEAHNYRSNLYKKKSPLVVANSMEDLAIYCLKLGNFEECKKLLDYSYDLKKQNCKESDPEIANIEFNLGQYYEKMGDFQQAKIHYKKSLKIRIMTYYITKKVDLGNVYHSLGSVCIKLGDLNEAEESLNESLNIRRGLESKQDISNTLYELGLLHEKLNNQIRSQEYFRESIKLREELLSKSNIPVSYPKSELVKNNVNFERWNRDDTLKWISENNINIEIVKAITLAKLDGKALKEIYDLYLEEPEIFSDYLKKYHSNSLEKSDFEYLKNCLDNVIRRTEER